MSWLSGIISDVVQSFLKTTKESKAALMGGILGKSIFLKDKKEQPTPIITKPRPWEESTGIWAWPELWKEASSGQWGKRFEVEGLGEAYDPTLPTDIPEYPSISSLMDDLLNLRKREGRRKGHASTRITRGELGSLDLSKTGLFPI